MSLLNTLWDDILAGPPPDKGLGKLRKQSSNLSFRSLSSDKAESETAGNSVVDSMRVTRSIMIAKPERTLSDTPPASPAGSTPPVSPFAGGGGGTEPFRFRRKSASDAFEKASGIGNRSPRPPYEL